MKTATELRAELAEAERLEREANEQRSKDRQASWKLITDRPDSWEWIMTPATERRWFSADKKEMTGLRISCRVKPEVVGQWMQTHGNHSLPNDRDPHWQGMFYYRTDENILTHEGGGTHVLTSVPKLCSDEEWAELVAGRVPDKFRAGWIGGRWL